VDGLTDQVTDAKGEGMNLEESVKEQRRDVLDRMWQHCEFPASGDDPEDEDAVDALIRAAFDEGVRQATEFVKQST
jgi:hypothetical protein